MNQVLFVIIVLVILYMFRDKWLKYMPDIVKKNVLVSGLVFGFVLCFFMGNNIEGFDLANDDDRRQFEEKCCNGNIYDGSVEGCEATNSSGDELIPGGAATATAMCQRLDQLRAESDGGTVGAQRERINRLNTIKENLSPQCCAGDSWDIGNLFTCLSDIMNTPGNPYNSDSAQAWQALTGLPPGEITAEGTQAMRDQLCN